jgi:hypothetical protein
VCVVNVVVSRGAVIIGQISANYNWLGGATLLARSRIQEVRIRGRLVMFRELVVLDHGRKVAPEGFLRGATLEVV